jgi:hypothetical protein
MLPFVTFVAKLIQPAHQGNFIRANGRRSLGCCFLQAMDTHRPLVGIESVIQPSIHPVHHSWRLPGTIATRIDSKRRSMLLGTHPVLWRTIGSSRSTADRCNSTENRSQSLQRVQMRLQGPGTTRNPAGCAHKTLRLVSVMTYRRFHLWRSLAASASQSQSLQLYQLILQRQANRR